MGLKTNKDKANRERDARGKFNSKGNTIDINLTRAYTSKELELIKQFEANKVVTLQAKLKD